jgi:hypothetical protein
MAAGGGRHRWYVPDGFLPSRSSDAGTSHEAACLLNTADEPAHIRMVFYFEDREPPAPLELVVDGRRTRHVRLDQLSSFGASELPRDVPYAYTVESDTPVVLQHSRLDTSGGYTLFTTIAYGE